MYGVCESINDMRFIVHASRNGSQCKYPSSYCNGQTNADGRGTGGWENVDLPLSAIQSFRLLIATLLQAQAG